MGGERYGEGVASHLRARLRRGRARVRSLGRLAQADPGTIVSTKKHNSSLRRPARTPAGRNTGKKVLAFGIPVALLMIGVWACVASFSLAGLVKPNTPAPTALHKAARRARSLDELLAMSPEQLSDVDIAEMNLLCATGLPGAEDMDIGKCLAKLDQWAARVRHETERHLYRLTDPRYRDHAEHYKHSEARFRAEWLVSVLQQDIGLHYHAGFVPADKAVVPPKTSKEHFLHGLMDNEDAYKAFGGNCVSLPVAYVAVGRRLAYPVKLVCSKEHIFCRWEGQNHPNPAWRDRFNFDGAGKGFSIDPDEFYLSWPRKSTSAQVELCDWLKSLTPQQELALFVAHRGHILANVKKDLPGALIAFSHAARLWASSRSPLEDVTQALDQLWKREVAAHPDTYRKLCGPHGAQGVSRYGKLPPRAGDASTSSGKILPGGRRKPVVRPTSPTSDVSNEINRRNMQRMMQTPVVPRPPSPYGPHQPGAPHP